MISENEFMKLGRNMSYEEYKACYCPECNNKDCIHREAYRRVPSCDGGLGLCPNLNKLNK